MRTKSKTMLLSSLEEMVQNCSKDKRLSLKMKTTKEVFESEVSYLEQLEKIINFFWKPLQEKKWDLDFMPLFSEIETLYQVNKMLLEELKTNQDNIGVVFIKMAPFFKIYSVYACNYRIYTLRLQKAMDVNKKLKEFINNQENRPEVGHSLFSLLITPIQRIPRYRLLFKELLVYTGPDHLNYIPLSDALCKIEDAVLHIDKLVLEQDNTEKLVELSKHVYKVNIILPGRRLIKEGKLMKLTKKGSCTSRHCVLFTDCFMIFKTSQFNSQLILCNNITFDNSLSCPTVDPLLGSVCFKIGYVVLCATDQESGLDWINCLRTTIKQYNENQKTLRRETTRTLNENKNKNKLLSRLNEFVSF